MGYLDRYWECDRCKQSFKESTQNKYYSIHGSAVDGSTLLLKINDGPMICESCTKSLRKLLLEWMKSGTPAN